MGLQVKQYDYKVDHPGAMCTDGHHGVSYGQTVTEVHQLTNNRVQMGPDVPLNHTPQIQEVCDICDFVSRFVSFVSDIPKN